MKNFVNVLYKNINQCFVIAFLGDFVNLGTTEPFFSDRKAVITVAGIAMILIKTT